MGRWTSYSRNRNFYVGVRTPWTLASPLVWERTHRLAAWLFAGCGLLGFVLVVAGVPWWASVASFVPRERP